MSHKVGWHIGNVAPWDAGDRSVMEAVPPAMVTFISGEGFWPEHMRWILEDVNPDCHFCFRPYFLPSNYHVDYRNYLNSVESMLDQPTWDFIPEGQRHLQIFNEQNMPSHSQWEGFGDTVDDMLRFDEWFCQGYDQLKDYGFKIGWTPLTIGNRDVFFPSDPENVPYYMHGSEAAKPEPTSEEIQAAILSGPCYDSLMRADEYYAHIYVINSPEVGIYEPWFGLRFAEYAKFFPKPLDIWINENFIGYPVENWGLWYDLLENYPDVKGTSIWILHHDIPDADHSVVRYLEQYVEGQPPEPPPEPPPSDLDEILRIRARVEMGCIDIEEYLDYYPQFAFTRYAAAHDLGAQLTNEFDVGDHRAQGFAGGIVFSRMGEWDQASHVKWQ